MNDQTEAEKIKTALKQTRDTREHARVVAVNMVRINRQSPAFAAEMPGVDRGTVSDWLDAYGRDDRDGRFEAETTRNSVDTSTPGTYTVSYRCVDSAGHENRGNNVRTVYVVAADVDLDPVLAAPADYTVCLNSTFAPKGATCTDHEDGNLNGSITIEGAHGVDTGTPGTYYVYYRCTDSAGNFDDRSVAVTVQ